MVAETVAIYISYNIKIREKREKKILNHILLNSREKSPINIYCILTGCVALYSHNYARVTKSIRPFWGDLNIFLKGCAYALMPEKYV